VKQARARKPTMRSGHPIAFSTAVNFYQPPLAAGQERVVIGDHPIRMASSSGDVASMHPDFGSYLGDCPAVVGRGPVSMRAECYPSRKGKR